MLHPPEKLTHTGFSGTFKISCQNPTHQSNPEFA